MQKIYLDCAATTKPYESVISSVTKNLNNFYNPSAMYKGGLENSKKIKLARDNIKYCLGVKEGQIYFTSSGSESDNWVLKGYNYGNKKHIITTKIEHHAILRTCEQLEREGHDVTYLDVDNWGRVTVEDVLGAIREDTGLISIMMVNNVLGTREPIAEIVKAVKKVRPDIAIHTDAVQLVGHEMINVEELGVDFLSASGHKFGAPKGIGFLYSSGKFELNSLICGGGQEFGLRAGTENIPWICAISDALSISLRTYETESKWCEVIWNYLKSRLIGEFTDIILNGPDNLEYRVPSNINIAFKGISSESLVLNLDDMGIMCSVGSACDTGDMAVNYVLDAIGVDDDYIEGGLRLSYNAELSLNDCDVIIDCLKVCLEKMRGYV